MQPEHVDLGYGSHVGPLAWAVTNTKGPVMEYGCGWWSTPLLRCLCLPERQLVSCDYDQEWIKKVQAQFPMQEKHTYHHVRDWETFTKDQILCMNHHNIRCGVVFIDHAPGERRVDDIILLAEHAEIIVVHDAQNPQYGYEPAYRHFKHVRPWHHEKIVPGTTLLSNFNTLAGLR